MNTDTVTLPVKSLADVIRAKILENFELIKPSIATMQEYGLRISALSEEYHLARLKEVFPSATIEEATLAVSLDVRATPASLDKALATGAETPVSKIVCDRVKGQFHLFV